MLGDPDQLGQLVTNLMRNAVIHTPAGTPIEVGVSAAGGPVRIGIRDHGPGIPPDAGDQLFERFWRTEHGRTRGRGGAGLGLSIAKAIVVAHGGTVAAHNAPDGGAVFEVTLPAVAPEPASQESLSVLTTDSYLDRAQ